MAIGVLGIVAGVGLGWFGHGHLRRLCELRMRTLWPVTAALVLQVGLAARGWRVDTREAGVLALGVGWALVAMWLVEGFERRDALRAPIALLLVGWLMNLSVVVANRGMPVSGAALARAGISTRWLSIADGRFHAHVLADAATRLRWLGDIVAPLPHVQVVFSLGDVAIAIGVAWLLSRAMRTPALAPAV